MSSAFILRGILAMVLAVQAQAQEWRTIKPIATRGPLPAGARVVENKPVPPAEIQRAAEKMTADWNRSDATSSLSADFYDATRHQDAMITKVPRDARLVLESVRGVQTLQQYETLDPTYGKVRVSTVSATLSTRIQLNDAAQGYASVPGVNEVLFEVMEPLK